MRQSSTEIMKKFERLKSARKSPSHIWKKYILEFINQLRKDEFTIEEIVKYLKSEYGQTYEDLNHEQFEGRIKSTLNQLTKDGSFRKSRNFDYELEKHGLYDIKLEKYKNHWSVNRTTVELHKQKQGLLQKLKSK